ncbi:uncharacterized protein FRV6_16885 [Fusarium oxysporum]|uniref:Uncharacterized protein n=1 Tax=Fusarium oxysporum TaxID=5507 RepID=A0A2H3TVY5_FUSOX|nr:uncharacterized protein FRV6_16885 [Fusarium oxysporum]
MFITSYWP